MEAPSATPSAPPTFLSLPLELRNAIYSILLRSANNRYTPFLSSTSSPSRDIPPSLVDPTPEDPAPGPRYNFDLSLFLVSRQISQEARKIFRDNIFVKITTPFTGAIAHVNTEGKVAVVCEDAKAQDFQDFHLRVLISTPDYASLNLGDDSYSMITCLDDLPAFTRIWYFSNLNSGRQLNAYLTLRLDLKNPWNAGTTVPKSLQEKLLLPFGEVKDLHRMRFDFHGSPFFPDCTVYPSIKAKVQKEQAIPAPTPEECVEECWRRKHLGLEKLAKKDYTDTLEEYVRAFGEIFIFVEGRKREVVCDAYFSTELDSGTFKGQYGHSVRLHLRVQLVACVMQAYLLMGDYEEAWFWGQRSVRLMREGMQGMEAIGGEGWNEWVEETVGVGFPGRKDMAWVFFRSAVARRKVLEEEEREVEVEALIFAAERFAVGDQLLGAELKAWRLRELVKEETNRGEV